MNRLIGITGNFHPVLVHLPIGFLLLAIVLQWLANKERYAQIQSAVRIAYFLGAVSAILSCFTGLALSSGGEYEADTLQFHKWFGISVAIISSAGYVLSIRPASLMQKIISIVTFVLIVITGHLGGTLTHGDGFLTKGFSSNADSIAARRAIPNAQEAIVFTDIIQPVLIEKCGSCHSAVKQKGGLRLDGKEWVLKGGKDGLVFASGDPLHSAMYTRLVLDPLEEKHMPPKGKPQLTEQEIALVHWWISSNAGFEKKAKEVVQPASINAALLALQSSPAKVRSLTPTEEVEKVSPAIIDSLRKAGIAVSQVAVNSNYLQASFVSMPKPGDKAVGMLQQVKKQLIWLKLPGAQLSAASWNVIAGCKALIRLSVERSNISDTTIGLLNSLQNLQYLNLVGTRVTTQGIRQLTTLPVLENLYLGKTGVKNHEFAILQKAFPKTIIDSGNYQLANLATDTQALHPPPARK
jgi:uncharacterized membrane protein